MEGTDGSPDRRPRRHLHSEPARTWRSRPRPAPWHRSRGDGGARGLRCLQYVKQPFQLPRGAGPLSGVQRTVEEQRVAVLGDVPQGSQLAVLATVRDPRRARVAGVAHRQMREP